MKLIDIANKIENEELKLPVLLKVKQNSKNVFIRIFETKKAYWETEDGHTGCIITFDDLFREVEIIEEDKEIEEIKVTKGDNCRHFIEYDNKTGHHKYTIRLLDEYFSNKINELVREVNKIKKESK